jgi:2,3-bisphosphoglycerate-dependent phosphoglycerate mutase
MHDESIQAKEWSQIFSEETIQQSIPVITAWQLNERMYNLFTPFCFFVFFFK